MSDPTIPDTQPLTPDAPDSNDPPEVTDIGQPERESDLQGSSVGWNGGRSAL
ncbi:hypothetical protein YK56LOC_38350 [Caballeronia sp. HLA56]